ncbi:hypothetical protein ABZP36_014547 [Zizania latifolia]
MDWVMRLPVGAGGVGVGVDALVVAGDVAETWDNFARTMAALRERFGAIFYVPGNHDLWLHRENGRYMDSLEKLTALLDACSELGVEIAPYELRTISGPVTDPSKLPKWDYDSSSTSQAPARTVSPKTIFKQPDLVCLVASGTNSVVLTVPHSKLVDPKRGRTEVFDGFSTVFSPDSQVFIESVADAKCLVSCDFVRTSENKKKPLKKHFKNSMRHLHHLPTDARAGFFIGDGAGVGKGRKIGNRAGTRHYKNIYSNLSDKKT